MSSLKVRVLGGFDVHDEAGQAIKLHTRKAAALLAYLAMTPGKEFSRSPWPNVSC